MEKEMMEIEKSSFERLLKLAGKDPETITIKKKEPKRSDEDTAIENYRKDHPNDPDPIGSYVLSRP